MVSHAKPPAAGPPSPLLQQLVERYALDQLAETDEITRGCAGGEIPQNRAYRLEESLPVLILGARRRWLRLI